MLPLCRNQPSGLQSTSMGQFLYNVDNQIPTFPNINFSFHEEVLLPFLQMSNLTRLAFHKSLTRRIQSENLPNNSDKQLCYFEYQSSYIYPDLMIENNLNLKGYY